MTIKKKATARKTTPKAKQPARASVDGLAMTLFAALSVYRRSHTKMSDDDVLTAIGKLARVAIGDMTTRATTAAAGVN